MRRKQTAQLLLIRGAQSRRSRERDVPADDRDGPAADTSVGREPAQARELALQSGLHSDRLVEQPADMPQRRHASTDDSPQRERRKLPLEEWRIGGEQVGCLTAMRPRQRAPRRLCRFLYEIEVGDVAACVGMSHPREHPFERTKPAKDGVVMSLSLSVPT